MNQDHPQKIVISHPTGNQFFRHALQAFFESGQLQAIFTCIAACDKNVFSRLGNFPGLGEISRRELPFEYAQFLHLNPGKEILRLLCNRTGLRKFTREEDAVFSVDRIYRDLDTKVARYLSALHSTKKGCVYSYDDGALKTFEVAKANGWSTCLDLPIAYWEVMEQLLKEEAERYPEWSLTLLGHHMSDFKKERKTKELALADQVICPSEFVRRSLPSEWRDSPKVHVVPFGTPTNYQTNVIDDSIRNKTARALRLLFVGSMSQRKGLADIFAAMRLLNTREVELHIVGETMLPLEFYRSQYSDFIYHSTMPHTEVLKLMTQCDALLLPSIVEGRALVQQEAMACGLPLIVTANAGAEDLIEEGVTGFLVPIRSPEAIATAIHCLLEKRKQLPSMSQMCKTRASQITWEAYRDALQRVVLKNNHSRN